MVFALFIFFISIISISILVTVRTEKCALYYIPISGCGIIFVLYVFGIIGIPLNYGVWLVTISVFFLYAYIIFYVIKKKNIGNVVKNSAWIIGAIIVYIVLIYINYGRVAKGIDEFSHWIECVKSMTYINDFTTNPLSNDALNTYPPAMALIQYYYQKLFQAFSGSGYEFSEWSAFFVYQLFMLSFYATMIGIVHPKKKITWLMAAISFLIFPTFFYSVIYGTVEIDSFLATIGGTGIAYVLWKDEIECWDIPYVSLVCAITVLTKDMGALFAIIMSVLMVMRVVLTDNGTAFKGYRKIWSIIPLACTFVIRWTWSHEVNVSGARKPGSIGTRPVDVREFLKLIFTKKGSDFKISVMNHFNQLFVQNCLIVVTILLAVSIGIYIYRRKTLTKRQRRFEIIALLLLIVQFIGYTIGVLAVHLYQFTEYEAKAMESFNRYMNADLMAMYIVVATIAIKTIDSVHNKWFRRAIATVVMIVLVVFSDWKTLRLVALRQPVAVSQNFRLYLSELNDKLRAVCDGDDKIWYVARGDSGTHSGGYCLLFFHAMRFLAEPNTLIVSSCGWGLGPQLSEQDLWYYDITADEWMDELINDNYDYVAIWYAGDEFAGNFGSVFESVDEIANNCVYKVDGDRRLLILCN